MEKWCSERHKSNGKAPSVLQVRQKAYSVTILGDILGNNSGTEVKEVGGKKTCSKWNYQTSPRANKNSELCRLGVFIFKNNHRELAVTDLCRKKAYRQMINT
jgi:hypothetical protein